MANKIVAIGDYQEIFSFMNKLVEIFLFYERGRGV